ncbi:MAG: hypothetical protein PHP53_24245 [Prolixibacteraceae bacterium]|nr:hypothetical protein [Prolixibacteraceae bacterium]
MKNYIQIIDSEGNYITPEWVTKSLKDLNRFSRGYHNIINIVEGMLDSQLVGMIPDYLVNYSEDFYTTWHASSTELVQEVGIDIISSIFETLRKVNFITWPDEMLEISEFYNGEIDIFRGESRLQYESGEFGLSWTTNKEIAEVYKSKNKNGLLLFGKVHSDNIWAFFSIESEIVVSRQFVKIEKIFD